MTTANVHHNQKLSFDNVNIYVGLDVHKKSWQVTVRFNGTKMKTFSMNPNPEELKKHLEANYPKGIYHTVYEAGFCGFWIHRKLIEFGINNIVVNPADIPLTHKDKQAKSDTRDSKTLAKTLENGDLTAIHIPSVEEERFRDIYRYREQLKKDLRRCKNRIKSVMALHAITVEIKSWGKKEVSILKSTAKEHDDGYVILELIEDLKHLEKRIKKQSDKIKAQIKLLKRDREQDILQSVPGVGVTTSELLIAEVINPDRFKSNDQASSYAGLIPGTASSGEKETSRGITTRRKGNLRHVLIESSWIAVEKDPELALAYSKLCSRMKKTQAIVRIAKKLFIRILKIWRNIEPYKVGVNMG